MATCPAANEFRFSFASYATQQLSYGSTYPYSARTTGGTQQTFTMALSQDGLSSTAAGGQTMPRIGTVVTGPAMQNALNLGGVFVGRTGDITGSSRVIRAVFTFSQPVRSFSMTLFDVDAAPDQFRDWIGIWGTDAGGSRYTPALVSPAGNGNQTGQPATAAGSSVTFQPAGTLAAQAFGNADSPNSSDTGTINVAFAQPVTQVILAYGNAPLTAGETQTSQQAVGISGIAYCPMPALTVTKTSTAVNGGLGAYNLPGAQVTYALIVTNSGGSPVDASSLTLADVLPVQVNFLNQPFDGTTTLPVKVVSAGGTTLTAAGLSYRRRSGGAFTYVPSPDADPEVGAIRIAPQGELAPGGTLRLEFRAVIR